MDEVQGAVDGQHVVHIGFRLVETEIALVPQSSAFVAGDRVHTGLCRDPAVLLPEGTVGRIIFVNLRRDPQLPVKGSLGDSRVGRFSHRTKQVSAAQDRTLRQSTGCHIGHFLSSFGVYTPARQWERL